MLKLGPALVMTPDLDAALTFYRDVLGLSLSARFETQLVFDLGGRSMHVFASARPAPAAEHGADGASVISFEVEAIEPAMAELTAKGVEFLLQVDTVAASAFSNDAEIKVVDVDVARSQT